MDSTQALPTQGQIDLFPWLSAPAKSTVQRIKRPPVQQRPQVQLEIEWTSDTQDDEDDPLITAPIIQRRVKAEECQPMAIAAPSSVFALAGFQVVKKAMVGRKPNQVRTRAIQEQVHLKIDREHGKTKVTRIHHTETDIWQEKEASRRARQVVPKPVRQSFEYSRKKAKV